MAATIATVNTRAEQSVDSSKPSTTGNGCTPHSTIDRRRSLRQTYKRYVELHAIAELTLKQPVPELPCLITGVHSRIACRTSWSTLCRSAWSIEPLRAGLG